MNKVALACRFINRLRLEANKSCLTRILSEIVIVYGNNYCSGLHVEYRLRTVRNICRRVFGWVLMLSSFSKSSIPCFGRLVLLSFWTMAFVRPSLRNYAITKTLG